MECVINTPYAALPDPRCSSQPPRRRCSIGPADAARPLEPRKTNTISEVTGTSSGKNSGQVSRLLQRLRTHGVIKKARGTYRYHLTKLGRRILALALKLRRFYLVPQLLQEALA